MLRPLLSQFVDAKIQSFDCRTQDGYTIGLSRVVRKNAQYDSCNKPTVLVTHGMTASTDMFVLPETRNFIEFLLDEGFDPWLFDWRGSCRLPYNSRGDSFKLDDVALYDVPKAVAVVREAIGSKSLYVVAHCVGALVFGQSMTAGLVKGLAGFVSQGVFLTPKMELRPQLSFSFLSELARPFVGDTLPVDFRKVGFFSRYTPLFALASIGAKCPDPTCQMLHNSAWCMGASLFEHDNLHKTTHDRLAELFGDVPMAIVPHLRKIVLARSLVAWHEKDPRYQSLPADSLAAAETIDCPLLLLAGSKNALWVDSNKLCENVLNERFPALNVEYQEIPAYGHFDTFTGQGAAYDVFPRVSQWIHRIANGANGKTERNSID